MVGYQNLLRKRSTPIVVFHRNHMRTPFKINKSSAIFLSIFTMVLAASSNVFAQQPPPIKAPPEDYTWWYLTLFVLLAALAGAIVYKIKSTKKDTIEPANGKSKNKKDNELVSFDAEEEMEWLRKNQNIVDRKRRKAPKKPSMNLPKTSDVFNSHSDDEAVPLTLEDLDSIPLPVFSFDKIERAKPYSALPLSNDEALMSAIEQTHDEYEEDEEVRDLAVRILAAFRYRNSVEALSQVAIYDLSATLRSKAVSVLSEFDHESVFETILLGCADPTREVRAASARALSRLSFDRPDAWIRIIETNEGGRIRQTSRAAIEGGFVDRSFDRLVNRDVKHAYESFVLLALVIKSGEIDKLIDAIKNHHDPRVKLAILHVFKITKDAHGLSQLYKLMEDREISDELKVEIDRTISETNLGYCLD